MRNERGSGTMLGASMLIVLLVMAFLAFLLSGWLSSCRKVRSEADLVALTAARAQAAGRSACEAAKAAVTANNKTTSGQTRLENCDVETGFGEFAVTVELRKEPTPRLPGGLGEVKARAKAGIIENLESAE